jgi:hypothetical protein
MTSVDHIFFRTDLPAQAAAAALGGLPGMTLTRSDRGGFFVTHAREDGNGAVGGEVQANDHLSYDDDPAVLDGYDTVLDVWSPGLEGDELAAEAERLFAAVTDALPWPALLVRGLDLLAAAWSPERGPRRFPAGTTPDPEDRAVWQDYALPPVTPATG